MTRPGAARRIAKRLLPLPRPWRWTDDTAMALSVVEFSKRAGEIDPGTARPRVRAEMARRSGSRLWPRCQSAPRARAVPGAPWRREARGAVRRQGLVRERRRHAWRHRSARTSHADLERVQREASRSGRADPCPPRSGAAGAIAVAVAAALASEGAHGLALLDGTIAATPAGVTRTGLERAPRARVTRVRSRGSPVKSSGPAATSARPTPFRSVSG